MSIEFEGAMEVGKPRSMTDEQCSSVWAQPFTQVLEDANGQKMACPVFVMCYQPSKEDKEAIAAGRPIWLKIMAGGLPPHALWTVNPETDEANV